MEPTAETKEELEAAAAVLKSVQYHLTTAKQALVGIDHMSAVVKNSVPPDEHRRT